MIRRKNNKKGQEQFDFALQFNPFRDKRIPSDLVFRFNGHGSYPRSKMFVMQEDGYGIEVEKIAVVQCLQSAVLLFHSLSKGKFQDSQTYL